MALQAVQFIASVNLTLIPANRIWVIPSSLQDTNLLIPNGKNVLIKKVCVDCVYNISGDLCVKDYYFAFEFLNLSNPDIGNISNIISPFWSQANQAFLTINKKNNILNTNIISDGIRIINNSGFLTSGIVLSNTTSIISSNISFLISLYYESI